MPEPVSYTHLDVYKRQQQVRSIVGAGVEYGMGCITDGRGRHNRPPVRVMPRPHQPRQGRNDTAHRDERQRVREVAMVLDRQQAVSYTHLDVYKRQPWYASPTSLVDSATKNRHYRRRPDPESNGP